MRFQLFGMICVLAIGCDESRPPAASSQSSEPRTEITANRPITTDSPEATTEPIGSTNTGINVRDRDSMAKTPFDQNENTADISITADIRKQIVDTKMSVDAQNVKIITQGGNVTLRGPVKTDEEKQRIEKIAMDVAGADKVDSQLEVNRE